MTRRIVGVLGGKGPEATEALLHQIIAHTPVKREEDHLRLLIDNNPQIPKPSLAISGEGDDPLPALIASAELLERAGADFIVIPCNSAHFFLEGIRRAVAIPVLSIIDETVASVKRAGCASVGLLASTGLVASGLYQEALAGAGISVVLPEEPMQAEMMDGILSFKDTGDADRLCDVLARACARLVDEGARGLVLGCTELPVVLAGQSLDVPLFDTIEILALAAVREALGEMEEAT